MASIENKENYETKENDKNDVVENIRILPDDIVNLIKEFIPKSLLVFTNRENYNLYHFTIKQYIKNY
jgi:hypothetical protein